MKRFPKEAVYIRDGNEYPVKWIFNNVFQMVTMDGDPGVMARTTTFDMHTSDLPITPRLGDQLRVDDVVYRVTEFQPDSESGLVLNLRK